MKIFLLKEAITDDITLQSSINLAISKCASIGFPLEFTQIETTKQFTSQPFSNAPNNEGYVSGTEIVPQEVFDEVKRLGYVMALDSIACIVFDPSKIIPSPTNPIDNGVCIQLPKNWYEEPVIELTNPPEAVFTQFLLHEMCHYLFAACNLPDTTHAYIPQFSQKSRTDYYLYLIDSLRTPFNALLGGAVMPPDAILTRNIDNGVETLGTLQIGSFNCKTLERPNLNNQPNISAIPVGMYNCKYTFSWRMLKYTYELQNVKGRSGIRIHSGNYFFDSDGCILLGDSFSDINHDGEQDVLNSRITVAKFEQLLGKKDFQILIK